MSATIIDGKEVAARVRAEVARDVAEFRERTGHTPGLATILVGDDPASAVYVANKRKACAEAGITDHHHHLPADATQGDVAAAIEECNHDPDVSGILLQL
ncbi:MAG TPA: tetrahydrofolate dehydrogenase/cyclohydrolase catalytic domain-containing protein, partial [Solirubrobacteraceae bacterium]|nr:tetrahydrofolate dehydrogenase/cyclohydrolase catalytic domain-containing protein [Solirubrobacteraceae bacterium]